MQKYTILETTRGNMNGMQVKMSDEAGNGETS